MEANRVIPDTTEAVSDGSLPATPSVLPGGQPGTAGNPSGAATVTPTGVPGNQVPGSVPPGTTPALGQ
jgi:hypothetical protein